MRRLYSGAALLWSRMDEEIHKLYYRSGTKRRVVVEDDSNSSCSEDNMTERCTSYD